MVLIWDVTGCWGWGDEEVGMVKEPSVEGEIMY
jgi:hypothetical protein